MKTNKLQYGFSMIMILVAIIAIGVVGFLSYRAFESINNDVISSDKATELQPAVAKDVPAAVEVVDTADLDKATVLLDGMDLEEDDSDIVLLDSEVDKF